MPVAGELHPVRQPQCQVADEMLRGLCVASPNVEAWDQLGVGVDRHPGPAVPSAFRSGLGRLYVLGPGIDERPNLIDLNALAGQVPKGAVLVVVKRRAGILQQFDNGVLAGTGQPRDCPDRRAFDHQAEDLSASFAGELVHTRKLTHMLINVKHKGQFDADGRALGDVFCLNVGYFVV